MKNLHFIFVLASMLLIAYSKTLFCSNTYPERDQFCPLIFEPVCANYPLMCLTPPCPQVQVQDFANSCEACADSNVESYVDGFCSVYIAEGGEFEDEVVENVESGATGEGEFGEEGWFDGQIVCHNPPGVEILCADIYDPVCGYVTGQDVGQTYANECVACTQGNVDYYVGGACPGEDEGFVEIF